MGTANSSVPTMKLSNESFVAKAPEAVIALERKKQADCESRIASIEQSIRQLEGK